MTIKGRFIDSEDGAGIPGVSVSVVDRFGASTGQGIDADDFGRFTLYSPLMDASGYYLLYATSQGYEPELIDPQVFESSNAVVLERAYQDLQNATVVNSNNNNKQGWWGWVIVAGVVLLLFKNNK